MVQRKGTVGGVPTNKTIKYTYYLDSHKKGSDQIDISWEKEEYGRTQTQTQTFSLNKSKRWELFDGQDASEKGSTDESTRSALKKDRIAKNRALKKEQFELDNTKDKHLKRKMKKERQQQRIQNLEGEHEHKSDNNGSTTTTRNKNADGDSETYVDIVKYGLEDSKMKLLSKKNKRVVDIGTDELDQNFSFVQQFRDAGYEVSNVKITEHGSSKFNTSISPLHRERRSRWEKYDLSEEAKAKRKMARDWKGSSFGSL